MCPLFAGIVIYLKGGIFLNKPKMILILKDPKIVKAYARGFTHVRILYRGTYFIFLFGFRTLFYIVVLKERFKHIRCSVTF